MNSNGPTVETQELARRLVALESAAGKGKKDSDEFLRVCEKLRQPISTLAGTAGFRALVMRALAVARTENSALSVLQVRPDGNLDGLEKIAATDLPIAATALIAQLIDLLVTFIGEALTIQLIQEQWPDLPGSDLGGSQTK